jgi:hypothetical protein
MIAKSLIAAAAVATTMAVALPASQAEAKTNVDINIGFGVGGYYPGYYGYGYGPVYNPQPNYISCKRGRNIVDNSGFHNVSAIDCSLPSYKYVAWKKGHKFVVSVNRYGNIYNVNKVF